MSTLHSDQIPINVLNMSTINSEILTAETQRDLHKLIRLKTFQIVSKNLKASKIVSRHLKASENISNSVKESQSV